MCLFELEDGKEINDLTWYLSVSWNTKRPWIWNMNLYWRGYGSKFAGTSNVGLSNLNLSYCSCLMILINKLKEWQCDELARIIERMTVCHLISANCNKLETVSTRHLNQAMSLDKSNFLHRWILNWSVWHTCYLQYVILHSDI